MGRPHFYRSVFHNCRFATLYRRRRGVFYVCSRQPPPPWPADAAEFSTRYPFRVAIRICRDTFELFGSALVIIVTVATVLDVFGSSVIRA